MHVFVHILYVEKHDRNSKIYDSSEFNGKLLQGNCSIIYVVYGTIR